MPTLDDDRLSVQVGLIAWEQSALVTGGLLLCERDGPGGGLAAADRPPCAEISFGPATRTPPWLGRRFIYMWGERVAAAAFSPAACASCCLSGGMNGWTAESLACAWLASSAKVLL